MINLFTEYDKDYVEEVMQAKYIFSFDRIFFYDWKIHLVRGKILGRHNTTKITIIIAELNT